MECKIIKIIFMKNFNEVGLGIWYDVIKGKILWSELFKCLSLVYKFTQALIFFPFYAPDTAAVLKCWLFSEDSKFSHSSMLLDMLGWFLLLFFQKYFPEAKKDLDERWVRRRGKESWLRTENQILIGDGRVGLLISKLLGNFRIIPLWFFLLVNLVVSRFSVQLVLWLGP